MIQKKRINTKRNSYKRVQTLGAMPQSLDIIRQHCKSDHFNSSLIAIAPHKSSSMYNKDYQQNNQCNRIQKDNIIYKNYGKSTSLHHANNLQSSFNTKKLPSLYSGSTYKDNFTLRSSENIIRAKERQSSFLKLPHVLPAVSSYKKSYEPSQNIVKPQLDKGIPLQTHLIVRKQSKFKGGSIYRDSYAQLNGKKTDSTLCIRNKDHLRSHNPINTVKESQYKKSFLMDSFVLTANKNMSKQSYLRPVIAIIDKIGLKKSSSKKMIR